MRDDSRNSLTSGARCELAIIAQRPVTHLTRRPPTESRPAPRRPRRGAFALAILAVLATVAPEQAAAQTVRTFISNTGQTSTTASNVVLATGFTTGAGTYTVSSIGVDLRDQTGSTTPAVRIYDDNSGNPGTLVATMTNPGTITENAVNTYTAPPNTTLSASTAYWVVTSNSAATTGAGFKVSLVVGSALDSGTAAGWSIGAGIFKNTNSDTSWSSTTSRIRFQIRGTIVNTAPTVENTIPDQSATAGTAFTYAFPDTTFSDAEGDMLTYTATKPDGTVRPTWLMFSAATRTFSGTPQAADVGTVSVKVVASDGNGESVSDAFDIVVTADTTPPTLTSATVNSSGQIIEVHFSENLGRSNLPRASDFTVTAGGSAVTVSLVASTAALNVLWVMVTPAIHQGQAIVVTYTDPTAGDDVRAIQDVTGNDAATFTTGMNSVPAVTNNSTVPAEVPADWSLKPTGLNTGARFRLLFLSSTKRNALSTDIADYNTFVQTRAAAGHADIQAYSGGFRVVGCTAAVDARDNTLTTYTTTAKGVPIYWLNGAKAADQYEDFYDGSWDDEVNDKNESGTDAHDTSQEANYPFTGCMDDGTESFAGAHRPRSLGAALGLVRVGRLNSSGTLQDPLDGNYEARTGGTRPMYGLSGVFQVAAAPSLTSAVVNETGQLIQLEFSENLQSANLPPASAFTVTVGGTAVTVSAVAAGTTPDVLQISVSPYITPGQAVVVAYTDPTAGDDVRAIQDTAGLDTPDFTTGSDGVPAVTNSSTAGTAVPGDWSLKPTGLTVGAKFRLLFLSSTRRDASSTDIATYNTFVQDLAEAGHADIQAYSAGFRVVGCTADVDARDNTSTTYTASDKGVPIYWLNGTKAVDDYEDFYDGDWDDEANDKNESGTDGPDTSQFNNYPWTGCEDDGTGAPGRQLGAALVRDGRPNSSGSGHGPLDSGTSGLKTFTHTLYGLSAVFQVAASTVVINTPATGAPTITGTPQVGQTLTAVTTAIMDVNGLNNVSYTYQWIRVATDNTETNIGSATASTYTLVTDDLGTTIKVKVSFTDDASNAETRTSVATAVVSAAADTTPPTLSSATVEGAGQQESVRLTFSENLMRTNLPTAAAFTVTARGTTFAVTGVFPPTSINPRLIQLQLSNSSLIGQGGAVAVTYTDPTNGNDTNAIQDTAGNDVATFTTGMNSVPAVTNNSTITVPGAPTGLIATANGQTIINLSWTAAASVPPITGHKIEYSPDGTSNWTDLVANAVGAGRTHQDMGLAPGTTRYYRVSAINGVGAGPPSNVDSATTGTAANAATTASDGTVTATEDTDYTFTAANFNFSDTDAGAALSSVKITSLPASGKGTLKVDGTVIASGALPKAVTKVDIDASKLTYSPPPMPTAMTTRPSSSR